MNNVQLQDKYSQLLLEKKLESDTRKKVVGLFINYACKELGIKTPPNIFLNNDINFGSKNKTFGHFNTVDDKIVVAAANRNLADVLRTIAHELTHYKQKLENKLDSKSGETGSEIENEANAEAGVMMRNFGKLHPEIYE
jgi:hypothetical protein